MKVLGRSILRIDRWPRDVFSPGRQCVLGAAPLLVHRRGHAP